MTLNRTNPNYPIGFDMSMVDPQSGLPEQVDISLDEFCFGPFVIAPRDWKQEFEAVYDTDLGQVIGYRAKIDGRWQNYKMPVACADIVEAWLATADGLHAVQYAITKAIEEDRS